MALRVENVNDALAVLDETGVAYEGPKWIPMPGTKIGGYRPRWRGATPVVQERALRQERLLVAGVELADVEHRPGAALNPCRHPH
jgi:hypothetical protein